jgi:hypothetical protein
MSKDASPAEPAPPAICLNCGAELHGKYCHACGQPVKGMIRPLSGMLHDVADTISTSIHASSTHCCRCTCSQDF